MSGWWYFLSMPRHAPPVNLTQTDRLELERGVAAHRTPQQVSQRGQIVLAADQGQQDKTIAADLEINFKTAALWRNRFRAEGPDCLWEAAEGRGRKARLTSQDIRADRGRHASNPACGGNALELPDHGQSAGGQQGNDQSPLAGPSSAATPDQAFQTLPGPQIS